MALSWWKTMDDPNPIVALAILLIAGIVGGSIVVILGITFTGPPIG